MVRGVRKALPALCLGAAATAWWATLVKATSGAPDPGDAGGLVIDLEAALPSGIPFAPGSGYTRPKLGNFSLYWGSVDRANNLTTVTNFDGFATMGQRLDQPCV